MGNTTPLPQVFAVRLVKVILRANYVVQISHVGGVRSGDVSLKLLVVFFIVCTS
jgi:hypothetical protein